MISTKLNQLLEETRAGDLLSRDERYFVEKLLLSEYEWDFCYDGEAIQRIKDIFWKYNNLVDELSTIMRGSFTAVEE